MSQSFLWVLDKSGCNILARRQSFKSRKEEGWKIEVFFSVLSGKFFRLFFLLRAEFLSGSRFEAFHSRYSAEKTTEEFERIPPLTEPFSS